MGKAQIWLTGWQTGWALNKRRMWLYQSGEKPALLKIVFYSDLDKTERLDKLWLH